jgi:hypothetical protein
MSLNEAVEIQISVEGDGTTKTFNIDLMGGDYTFSTPAPLRWFATDSTAPQPVAADVPSFSSYAASLSGTILTMTFNTAPPKGSLTNAVAILRF